MTIIPKSKVATSKLRRLTRESSGFSLVEILVVIAIGAVLSSFVVSGFGTLLGGGFNGNVTGLSSMMEEARSYAMANNTYVYVGLQEVDGSGSSVNPPAGSGMVLVALAASKDGSNGLPTWSGASNLVAISPLKKFSGLHLSPTQFGTTGNMARPASNPTYFLGSASCVATTTINWPIGSTNAAATYIFSKVIRFGPSGDANILLSSGNTTVDWIELGLQPIHGNAVASASTSDISAIQVDGMTGAVRIYRP